MRILNRSLPIFIRSSSLCCVARQTCRIGSTEKIIIPFSKNAGHLLISRDRETSDENTGLSLRMRQLWDGLVCNPTFSSWGSGGAVSPPAGSRAEPRKQTHFCKNLLRINLKSGLFSAQDRHCCPWLCKTC